MEIEQKQSIYYAWCRAQIVRECFEQSITTDSIESNHDILASSSGKFIFIWHGLLFAAIEFLDKFYEIPPTIAEEVRLFYEPPKRFRNAVFHIQNHPLSMKYGDLVGIPHSLARVEKIHEECGRHICNMLGFKYPPFVGVQQNFDIRISPDNKPK
jgi:hypothetical protein